MSKREFSVADVRAVCKELATYSTFKAGFTYHCRPCTRYAYSIESIDHHPDCEVLLAKRLLKECEE